MGRSNANHPPCEDTAIKRCCRCGVEQPASEFRPYRLMADGRSGHCKECDRKNALDSYYKHREKRLIYMAEWRKENPRNYKTPEARKYFNDRYHKIKHTKKFRDCQNAYQRKRRATNPAHRFEKAQRDRMNRALKYNTKSAKWNDLIGCTPRQAIYHLTNGGFEIPKGFHIDHHVPCVFFDLSIPEHQRVCFNWRNLRMLTAKDNLEKQARLPEDYRETLKDICAALNISTSVFNITT